ncbi:MAG: hypothetical protein WCI51_08025 [Lentisphaerota bacterium]
MQSSAVICKSLSSRLKSNAEKINAKFLYRSYQLRRFQKFEYIIYRTLTCYFRYIHDAPGFLFHQDGNGVIPIVIFANIADKRQTAVSIGVVADFMLSQNLNQFVAIFPPQVAGKFTSQVK